MNDSDKKELYAPSTARLYVKMATISGEGVDYAIVDDSRDVVAGGRTFRHTSFTYAPPDPSASSGTSTMGIDDLDLVLTSMIAGKRGPFEVSVWVVDRDDPDVPVTDVNTHDVTKMAFSSDGKVSLTLGELTTPLSFTASRYGYGATDVPGLFG